MNCNCLVILYALAGFPTPVYRLGITAQGTHNGENYFQFDADGTTYYVFIGTGQWYVSETLGDEDNFWAVYTSPVCPIDGWQLNGVGNPFESFDIFDAESTDFPFSIDECPLTLPTVVVGSSSTATLTITNDRTEGLPLDYTVSLGSCTDNITFTPSSFTLANEASQVVTFTFNATNVLDSSCELTVDMGCFSQNCEVIFQSLPCIPFNAGVTLSTEECSCSGIVITDTSVYDNTIEGHDSWGYRKIILLRPDGSTYVWSSESSEDPDTVITPHTNVSVDQFTYNFLSTDVDGIYDVKLYAFPNWDNTVAYNQLHKDIVYKNGVLYKIISSNTGQDPELDTDHVYWTVYEISDDTMATRYAIEKKIVVLCISLLKCKEGLVRDAFCGIESNPCGNLCGNNKFMSAMKFSVTEKAISISECAGDWTSVEKHIEILKSICRCGGGC